MCLALNDLKFSHIRTFEILNRQYNSKNRGYEPLNYSDDDEEEKEAPVGEPSIQMEPSPAEVTPEQPTETDDANGDKTNSKYLSKLL